MKPRYSSRKFWSMMLWQSVFTALLMRGFINGDQYSNLTLIILGAYFAANVGDKFAQRPPSTRVVIREEDGYSKPIE